MTDPWNEHANSWDCNPDVKFYTDQAFASLVATIDISGSDFASKRVLDFGCGTGLLSQKVARYVSELIAVDPFKKMLTVLQNKQIPKMIAVKGDVLSTYHPSDVG